jgi:hypothetical protein
MCEGLSTAYSYDRPTEVLTAESAGSASRSHSRTIGDVRTKAPRCESRTDQREIPGLTGLVETSRQGRQCSQCTRSRGPAGFPLPQPLSLGRTGLDASIGTVGDALDNALMESTIGLYKAELIKKDGPCKSLGEVELATADYIEWFNTRRLHTAIGGIPPAEYEAATTLKTSLAPRLDPTTLDPTTEASTKLGAVHCHTQALNRRSADSAQCSGLMIRTVNDRG